MTKKKSLFLFLLISYILLITPVKAYAEIPSEMEAFQTNGDWLYGQMIIEKETKIELYMNSEYVIQDGNIIFKIGENEVYVNEFCSIKYNEAAINNVSVIYSGATDIPEQGLKCYVFYINYTGDSSPVLEIKIKDNHKKTQNSYLTKVAVVEAEDIGEDRTSPIITTPKKIGLGFLNATFSGENDAYFLTHLKEIVNLYAVGKTQIDPYTPEPKEDNTGILLIIAGIIIVIIALIATILISIIRKKKTEKKEKEEFVETQNLKSKEIKQNEEKTLREQFTKLIEEEEIGYEQNTEDENLNNSNEIQEADTQAIYESNITRNIEATNPSSAKNKDIQEEKSHTEEIKELQSENQASAIPKFLLDIENIKTSSASLQAPPIIEEKKASSTNDSVPKFLL